MICVADNVRRAIEAVPKERLGANPALNSLVEGFEVTEPSLLTALSRYRVTRSTLSASDLILICTKPSLR